MRGVVFDPLAEAVPDGWAGIVAAAGLPGIWDADVLTSLAWCAQHPTYLGLATDAVGVPAAVFHVRHFGLPTRLARFVHPKGGEGPGLAECRLPPSYSVPGHAFHPDLDPIDRAAAVQAFETALWERLGRRVVGLAYRVVPEAEVDVFASGPGRRRSRAMHPEYVVDVAWSDVDEYLADLPAGVRRDVRRRRRRVDGDPTVTVEIGTSLPTENPGRLSEVVRRAHRPWWWTAPPVPRRYFDLLEQRPGIRFVSYARGGQLVAFELLTDDGIDIATLMWGVGDRVDHGRQHFYFDKHLRTIGYAIEHGRQRIRMGKGFGEVKTQFGARPSRAYLVVATH